MCIYVYIDTTHKGYRDETIKLTFRSLSLSMNACVYTYVDTTLKGYRDETIKLTFHSLSPCMHALALGWYANVGSCSLALKLKSHCSITACSAFNCRIVWSNVFLCELFEAMNVLAATVAKFTPMMACTRYIFNSHGVCVLVPCNKLWEKNWIKFMRSVMALFPFLMHTSCILLSLPIHVLKAITYSDICWWCFYVLL
jgi:hypothetical protein